MAGGVGVSRQISRTDALAVVGMAKSSVSSSAETAILNQQKMLRETLSSSSGTAVWIYNQIYTRLLFSRNGRYDIQIEYTTAAYEATKR